MSDPNRTDDSPTEVGVPATPASPADQQQLAADPTMAQPSSPDPVEAAGAYSPPPTERPAWPDLTRPGEAPGTP